MEPTTNHAMEELSFFDDLMSDQFLKDLLQSIYSISGLRISLTTCQGDRLLALHEYVTPFCKLAGSTPSLHEICRKCTRIASERAAESGKPYLYRCYAGFACAAIPVFAKGLHVGVLVTSGFRMGKEYMAILEQFCTEESYRVPPDVLETAPSLHYQRITDITNMLSVAARYIAEASLRRHMEAQVNQQKLEMMQQQQLQLNTERLLSQAEFKALQSQINPHFLFNTLNAISQLAILEGSDKTADAIFSLSALLRRSLKKNDTLPFLKEELDNIGEYINIKKLLYRDRIRYVYDVDPNCLSLRVPLFTLQPLVENALLHGLEPKPEDGTLTLSIRPDGDYVVVCVADDGAGCDPSFVESLKTNVPERSQTDLTGIGLGNVTSRLATHFGSKFYWEFESAPGKGTRVTLHLPAKEN